MKNKDIHKGFEEAEVRDFLSKSVVNSCYVGEVERLEKNIKSLQEQLIKARQLEAVMSIIKSKGWDVHDVSDYVHDYKSGEYFGFVGTKDEVKAMIDSIDNN